MALLATVRSMEPGLTDGRGIELRGLKKTYRSPSGPVPAVRGVDVVVRPGETVALLGPNGAGKSTTVDMLLGLQQQDEGTVAIFGGPPDCAIRAGRIGVMLQAGGVLRDLTVRELVAMMASLFPAPLSVDETLAVALLNGIADRRTERLSGGETQRVRFAVALVSDPDLLVLDEPTVGMDVESRHAFWTTVRELSGAGKTFLFATHYLEEADAYADRAVLMAHGRVVADGPTTQIKAIVGSRTIRATLPAVSLEALERLPGVTRAERRGEAIVLSCSDSDASLRALLTTYPQAHDIEVLGAGLEEAFLQLTADDEEVAA
jgi:ABC-2 type transport system ATP-binding protein